LSKGQEWQLSRFAVPHGGWAYGAGAVPRGLRMPHELLSCLLPGLFHPGSSGAGGQCKDRHAPCVAYGTPASGGVAQPEAKPLQLLAQAISLGLFLRGYRSYLVSTIGSFGDSDELVHANKGCRQGLLNLSAFRHGLCPSPDSVRDTQRVRRITGKPWAYEELRKHTLFDRKAKCQDLTVSRF